MAKVATRGPLPSNPIHFGGGVGGGNACSSKVMTAAKRKTPSELRGEQLKRKKIVELVDESLEPALGSLQNTNGGSCGLKKPDSSKNPRYIDTRMDELFPVRKNSIRLRLLSRKENAEVNIPVKQTVSMKSSFVNSELDYKRRPPISCPEASLASTAMAKDEATKQSYSTTEKCSESTFRSVTELSLGGQKLPGFSLDMDKAFKGLAAREPPVVSASPTESFQGNNDSVSAKFCSEFHISGQRTPLDFTLKTTLRLVTSSSVNWFHRLMTRGSYAQFNPQVGSSEDQKMPCSSSVSSTNQVSRALHSWVYPQGSLPPSVISALTLSAAREGQIDFLSKRQLAWEDSFRSLYYMLRKNICNLFYVCTTQFVAMFTGIDGLTESKGVCNAYISQSTRGLRSLLKEHDICFSMPLCRSKVEQVTKEDLFELSEIEKHNLGQTRRTASLSDVDNSPQSLLVFSGHENVHGLYDFLLNYRSFLTSLSVVDVPLLYSPVPFENAAFMTPEVRCKEVRRADNVSVPHKGSRNTCEPNDDSASDYCYSIEIKDAYLPPWIICSVCDAIESDGSSFEASFVTEPASIGLNVSLDNVCQKSVPEAKAGEVFDKNKCVFGIPNTTISPQLRSAYLKGLKYCNGSYTASLSPA